MEVYFLTNQETAACPVSWFHHIMPERCRRAERFRFEKDRLLCWGAGLLLHHLLPVDEKDLRHTDNGKPFVTGQPFFNLSHAGTTAVFVRHHTPVGIDIEPVGAYEPLVAEHVFTPRERQWMREHPAYRFYHLWCRKESLLKAVGSGLSVDPVTVELCPLQETVSQSDTIALYACRAAVSPEETVTLVPEPLTLTWDEPLSEVVSFADRSWRIVSGCLCPTGEQTMDAAFPLPMCLSIAYALDEGKSCPCGQL